MNINIQEIVEKYSDMLFRIAYQNCFNKSDSEDIVQEVFIKLIHNIRKIDTEEHLKCWLIRVTINHCKDFNKSSWYKKVEGIEENQAKSFLDEDDNEIIHEISKLKPKYRNIIYLYYFEGYKLNEIANILKMNINTVNSNLVRARTQLKNILEEGGDNYDK